MSDCYPFCSPWDFEFDGDHAWCARCGKGYWMRRTAEGHALGWARSDYRKRVS